MHITLTPRGITITTDDPRQHVTFTAQEARRDLKHWLIDHDLELWQRINEQEREEGTKE